MDWSECLKKRIVKKRSLDENLVVSLIKGSENKIKVNDILPLNEITASSKLCLAYDSLREILEAIATKYCYKIYNHECYVGFLAEVLSMKEESIDFDKFRNIRNSVNYYGKQIDMDDVENLMSDILKMRNKLVKLLR